MKVVMYPAVLYYDNDADCYSVAIHDIGVFTEGETIEEAYLSAKEFLSVYTEYTIELKSDFEAATPYIDVKKENEKNIVLLVSKSLN